MSTAYEPPPIVHHLPPVNADKGLDPHGPHVVSVQALSPRSGNPPAVAPLPENPEQ